MTCAVTSTALDLIKLIAGCARLCCEGPCTLLMPTLRAVVHRSGCSAEEFEELVQRNMAANCGMNYAFMTDFMRAILSREMDLLRYCCWLSTPCPCVAIVSSGVCVCQTC